MGVLVGTGWQRALRTGGTLLKVPGGAACPGSGSVSNAPR